MSRYHGLWLGCIGFIAWAAGCRSAIGVDELSFDNGFENGQGGAGGMVEGVGGAGGSGGVDIGTKCGDGKVDFFPLEWCDDGNNMDGDTCSSDCRCGVQDAGFDPTVKAFHGIGGEACYVYLGDSALYTEPEANSICMEFGGDLFSVKSASELQWVVETVGSSSPVWLGGKRLPGDPLMWRWLSGEPWIIKPCDPADNAACNETIDLWGAGQPDNMSGNEDCIQTMPSVAVMQDVACSQTARVVCQSGFFVGKYRR